MVAETSFEFYRTVPTLAAFRDMINAASCQPLPSDWRLGLADVVDSTGAVDASRYLVMVGPRGQKLALSVPILSPDSKKGLAFIG